MMTRRAMACVAAFAAAVSIGALGYAVLWAFDFAELARPAAQASREEAKRPAPRRKVPVIVAPRVPGEDVRAVASPAPHGMPFGDRLAVAPLAAPDEPSALVAVVPPPTPATPGEDVRAVASPAPHAMPFGDRLAVAPLAAPDEPSALVAVAPPPTPATPGEDGPAVAASARVSAASPAAGGPMSDDAPARSDLIPQEEATVSPIETLPDPEPTGTVTVHPGPLILHVPEPEER